MTKKQKQMLWSYEHARYNSLYDAYANPSVSKRNAWTTILGIAHERGTNDVRVTGRGTFTFSAAYKYNAPDGEHLCYETAQNTYDFLID